MSFYRKTLSVGGIVFSVESEEEFFLSERCIPFETEPERPDITLYLAKQTIKSDSAKLIHSGADFDIVQADGQLMNIRYDSSRKKEIVWYLKKLDPHTYQVFFSDRFSGPLQGINPLFFFDLAELLSEYDAMILHSSVIVYHGQAIAFTAPSQTGKSTQADLWHEHRGAEILNGDRGLIRRQDGGYRIYGSPYAGSSGIYVNKSAPLRAIVVLQQAPYNQIRRIGAKQAYLHLLSQTSISAWNRKTVENQSSWLSGLIQQVPVYLLECLPDAGAVDCLDQQLKGILYG